MISVPQFFDDAAKGWSERYAHDERFARRFDRITSLLAPLLPQPPFRAMDIGCGSGIFSRWMASRGAIVVACDISEQMLIEARKQSAGQPIEFFHGDIATAQTFGQTDVVLCLSVLEYVADATEALTALSNTAQQLLVLSVPNKSGAVRKFERLALKLKRATHGKLFNNRGDYLRHQSHQWTSATLDRELQCRGFQKTADTYVGTTIRFPNSLLPLFERRWWAAMYVAVYERVT